MKTVERVVFSGLAAAIVFNLVVFGYHFVRMLAK